MSIFSDLFVLQAVGILVNSKYSGTASFGFERTTADFVLNQGNVTHAHCAGASDAAALAQAIWQTRGRLTLGPGPQSAYGELDYTASVDKLIAESAPPMGACSMMEYLFLERGPLKPVQASPFTNIGFDILLHIKRGMKLYEARGDMDADAFWKGVLHLSSNGQVLPSYELAVGAFARRLVKGLEAQVDKLLGHHMLQAYREKVADSMRHDWPDWHPEQAGDPIHGTAMYRAWLRALRDELQHLGAPALTQRCYSHTLSALTPEENLLLQRLTQV